MTDLPDEPEIASAAAALRRGATTSQALTEACLERTARLDRTLNAYITLCAEQALAAAREADRELAAGRWRGPLHGIPIALKDLFATAGVRTTAGSALLRDWVPDRDATVVRRLKQAGAVLLGKLNMHELAYGATCDSEHFGPCYNPWDLSRSTGGSSGASASAVAAGLSLGSLGSDTGGSIRIPAALCGVVGVKPSYGRVSRAGAIPLCWSLDHVGPLARSSTDAGLLLEAIAGYDPDDRSSSRRSVPRYSRGLPADNLTGVRIAVPQEHFWDDADPEVARAVADAQAVLRALGARLEPVSIPSLRWARAAQTLIQCAEATACHRGTLRERAAELGSDVRIRLATGLFVSAPEYIAAQRARARLRRELLAALEGFAAFLTPACSILAPRIGERETARGGRRLPTVTWLTHCTFPFNLTGLPALSTPCCLTRAGGVGLQLAGRPFDEAALLRIGAAFEAATGFHRQRPPLAGRNEKRSGPDLSEPQSKKGVSATETH